MKLQSLPLSNRVLHKLQNNNINTTEDLTSCTPEELLSLHLIGPGAIDEIKAALTTVGLALRTRHDDEFSLSTPIDTLTTRTDDLYLSRPSVNALQRAGILTVKALLEEKRDPLSIKHVGPVKAAEIEKVRGRLRERFPTPQ